MQGTRRTLRHRCRRRRRRWRHRRRVRRSLWKAPSYGKRSAVNAAIAAVVVAAAAAVAIIASAVVVAAATTVVATATAAATGTAVPDFAAGCPVAGYAPGPEDGDELRGRRLAAPSAYWHRLLSLIASCEGVGRMRLHQAPRLENPGLSKRRRASVRRRPRMLKRVRTNTLPSGWKRWKGIQRSDRRGDVRHDIATRRAEHHTCEMDSRLEVQRVWYVIQALSLIHI